MLWGRYLERRPPDGVWLERICVTLGLLGYKIEEFVNAYAQTNEQPDPDTWFWWEADSPDAGTEGRAGGPGEGLATEDEIRDAWGESYERIKAETEAKPGSGADASE